MYVYILDFQSVFELIVLLDEVSYLAAIRQEDRSFGVVWGFCPHAGEQTIGIDLDAALVANFLTSCM